MTQQYNVDLDIYRGSNPLPIARQRLMLSGESALDACCRAQDILNLQVADNEYANASAAWPLRNPEPAAIALRAAA